MSTTTLPKIGFVGLGHMGGNMALRLLAAGYEVYGVDRSRPEEAGPDCMTACVGVRRRARSPRLPM